MRLIAIAIAACLAIAGEASVPVAALKSRFESWFPAYMNGVN